MDSRHTPGPWRYGKAENFEGFYIAPDVRLPTLAAVHNFPGETESNARLIAAAPEMLAALKAAKALTDNMAEFGECNSGEIFDAAFDLIRAAIAKTEGQS